MEVAILAGGLARRLGGVYKPLINICGKPVLRVICERLEAVASRIVVVVHTEEQERAVSSLLSNLGADIFVARDVAEVFSPLVGLYTASRHVSSPVFNIIPSDTPFISAETLQKIVGMLDDSADAVVPRWPNGYIEPLVAVYRRSAILDALKEEKDFEKPVSWLLQLIQTRYIEVHKISGNPRVEFFNLNTTKDLEEAEKICRELKPL